MKRVYWLDLDVESIQKHEIQVGNIINKSSKINWASPEGTFANVYYKFLAPERIKVDSK
jgi:hypothetical protein